MFYICLILVLKLKNSDYMLLGSFVICGILALPQALRVILISVYGSVTMAEKSFKSKNVWAYCGFYRNYREGLLEEPFKSKFTEIIFKDNFFNLAEIFTFLLR